MKPFLTSPRLAFRTWTEADLPLALSLWGDPEVALYLGGPLTLEATRAKLQVEMDRQQTCGIQYWPIFHRPTGAFAGAAGLRPFYDQANVRELGVHIARPFWSARLGEEAARAVIQYAFDDLHLEALTAGHNPGNTHSRVCSTSSASPTPMTNLGVPSTLSTPSTASRAPPLHPQTRHLRRSPPSAQGISTPASSPSLTASRLCRL